MIYVDSMQNYGNKGNWCHMWSDTNNLAELDTFAYEIGCQPHWFQMSRGISGDFPHYDLRSSMRQKALRHGAQKMELREWVKKRLTERKTE